MQLHSLGYMVLITGQASFFRLSPQNHSKDLFSLVLHGLVSVRGTLVTTLGHE